MGSDEVEVIGSWPGPMQLFNSGYSLFNPDLYKYTGPDGQVFVVDKTAGLKSLTDRAGNVLTMTPGRDHLLAPAGARIDARDRVPARRRRAASRGSRTRRAGASSTPTTRTATSSPPPTARAARPLRLPRGPGPPPGDDRRSARPHADQERVRQRTDGCWRTWMRSARGSSTSTTSSAVRRS